MLQVLIQNQETTRRIFFEYVTAKRNELKRHTADSSTNSSSVPVKEDPWVRYDRPVLRSKDFLKVFREEAENGVDGVCNTFNPKKAPLKDDSIFVGSAGEHNTNSGDTSGHTDHITALMDHNMGGVWGPSDFLKNSDGTEHNISPDQFSFLLKKFRDIQEIRERVLDLVAVRNWKFPPGADAPLSVGETMAATTMLCAEMEKKVAFWKNNEGDTCRMYIEEVTSEFVKSNDNHMQKKTCRIDNLTTLVNIIVLREKAAVFVQLESNGSADDSADGNNNSSQSKWTCLEEYEFSCHKHGLSLVSYPGFALRTAKLRYLEGELQKMIRNRVLEIPAEETKRMGLKRH
jgi:hypothetical protein